jgi:hypothetical protein
MSEQFKFEIVFSLPAGEHDPYALSDAVFDAGFEDAIIGTGNHRLLAVELEAAGEDAETVILNVARAIMEKLPEGTELREVRPDLVSLADVAEKLEVSRQTLQQREMPPPVAGGLYRIDEVAEFIENAQKPKKGRRRPKFGIGLARKWFSGGKGARALNAKLTLKKLNSHSLKIEDDDDQPKFRA